MNLTPPKGGFGKLTPPRTPHKCNVSQLCARCICAVLWCTLLHQSVYVCGSWGCVFWETPSKIWVKRPTEQAESQEADQSGYLICYNKICFCTGKFDSLGLFSVFLGWSQIYGRVLYHHHHHHLIGWELIRLTTIRVTTFPQLTKLKRGTRWWTSLVVKIIMEACAVVA